MRSAVPEPLLTFLVDVNHGDTITDFLPMERDRKITIQSAAISFHWPLPEACPSGVTPKTINLIDTPGHQDFRFEVDRCMPILDGAICIIDSVKGVEAHTERVWATAQQFKTPRIVYVNKLDRDGASFKKSVVDIASRLNSWPLVCQIPLWDKDSFVGVVDVIQKTGYRWQGTKHSLLSQSILQGNQLLWEEIETARIKLIEKLCEEDDDLVEAFAEHGVDLPAAAIKRSIHRAILSGDGRLAPIFAGSSLTNMGVEPLLDAIVDYLPNPLEAPAKEAFGAHAVAAPGTTAPDGKESSRPKAKRHNTPIGGTASVFKVVNDPKIFPNIRGMMTFVRVHNGTLYSNSPLSNLNLGPSADTEKPHQILQISASKTAQIPHLGPGQIGAIAGLKSARTGDTFVIWPSHSHLHKSPDWISEAFDRKPLEIPPAVAFLSLEPLTLTETKILEEALAKISREDPSLRWSKDEKVDIFILSGMGKLHLEVAIDRLKSNYKINALFGEIQVDYKESLRSPTGDHRVLIDKVIASKAGRAACTASVEPLEKGETPPHDGREHEGNLFDIKVLNAGEQVSVDSAPAGRTPLKELLFNGAVAAMARGPRKRFPMYGCRVTLVFDASTDYFGNGTDAHIVQAALHSVRSALNAAHTKDAVVLMEPSMAVTIHTPEDAAGAIQHDISSARGGHILEVREANTASGEGAIDLTQVYVPPDPYETLQSLRDPKRGVTRMLEIAAKVPLKEMLDYDALLRSKTGGRHSFTMKLDSFERVVGPREKHLC